MGQYKITISSVSEEHYKHVRSGACHQPSQLSFSQNISQQALGRSTDAISASANSFEHDSLNVLSGGTVVSAQGLHVKCQYCSFMFSSKSLLNRHMTDQHPELPMSYPYNCAECGRGFFSQSGLNHHIESHFVKSQCSICSHTFKYSRNLKRHLEFTHHMKECRQCKCYIGGETFRDHVRQCTGSPSGSLLAK